MVTNGTSTSNKIVGMYAAPAEVRYLLIVIVINRWRIC